MEYNIITSTMKNQAASFFDAVVDVWAYYGYKGKQRTLYISGDEGTNAGVRLKERFLTPEGKRIEEIPMGKSEEEAYKNLVKAFENKQKSIVG
jgi:hypothetical protein